MSAGTSISKEDARLAWMFAVLLEGAEVDAALRLVWPRQDLRLTGTATVHQVITIGAREHFARLVVPRLVAADHSVELLPDDDVADVVADLRSWLIGTDAEVLRSCAELALQELRDMLAAVSDNAYEAVAIIAEALLAVHTAESTDLQHIVRTPDLRAAVLGELFRNRGVRVWQHKTALTIARLTGQPLAAIESAVLCSWHSESDATLVAYAERFLPTAGSERHQQVAGLIGLYRTRANLVFRHVPA